MLGLENVLSSSARQGSFCTCTVRRQARRAGQEAVAQSGGRRRGGLLPAGHGQEPHGPAQRGQQVCRAQAHSKQPSSQLATRHVCDCRFTQNIWTWESSWRSLTCCASALQPQDADLPNPDAQPHLPGLRLQPAACASLSQGGQREGHRGDCGQCPAGGVTGEATWLCTPFRLACCVRSSSAFRCFRAAHASCHISCCIRAQIWDSMPGYSDCSFADSLWSAMDEAICLPDCDVYSYKSDGEDDPFGAFVNSLGVAACNLKLAHYASMHPWHSRMIGCFDMTQARLATSGPSTTSCTTGSKSACCTSPAAASPKPQVHLCHSACCEGLLQRPNSCC